MGDLARTYGPLQLGYWIEMYKRSWENADEEFVLTLFTEGASYRSSPFREPYRGHDEIRAYWQRSTRTQRQTRVKMGRPFIEDSRVAVEWWATMIDEGRELTLPGCLLLRFESDGRCNDLREYWNVEPGRQDPFIGWGT